MLTDSTFYFCTVLFKMLSTILVLLYDDNYNIDFVLNIEADCVVVHVQLYFILNTGP